MAGSRLSSSENDVSKFGTADWGKLAFDGEGGFGRQRGKKFGACADACGIGLGQELRQIGRAHV